MPAADVGLIGSVRLTLITNTWFYGLDYIV